jgi:hypothetical protein
MFSFILSTLLFISPTDSSHIKIWEHVFDSHRLKVIEDKISVVGTIHSIKKSFDGDIHINLKLDTLFHDDTSYLDKRNFTKQDGCLVVEIVCGHRTIFPICFNYKNSILIPQKGDRVLVTGPFVFDKRHGWTEIHPVYEIEFIY